MRKLQFFMFFMDLERESRFVNTFKAFGIIQISGINCSSFLEFKTFPFSNSIPRERMATIMAKAHTAQRKNPRRINHIEVCTTTLKVRRLSNTLTGARPLLQFRLPLS